MSLKAVISCLLSISLISGCQTGSVSKSSSEDSENDWFEVAKDTEHAETFSVALNNLIMEGKKNEVVQLIGEAESFNSKTTVLNKVSMPVIHWNEAVNLGFVPNLYLSWDIMANQKFKENEGRRLIYRISDKNQQVYWISFLIEKIEGKVKITEIRNLAVNQIFNEYYSDLLTLFTMGQEESEARKGVRDQVEESQRVYKSGLEPFVEYLSVNNFSVNNGYMSSLLIALLEDSFKKGEQEEVMTGLALLEKSKPFLSDFQKLRIELIKGNLNHSDEVVEAVAESLGGRAIPFYLVARYHYLNNEESKSEEQLKKSILEDPKLIDNYVLLMRVLSKKQEFEKVYQLTRLLEYRFYKSFKHEFFEESEDFSEYVESTYYSKWKRNRKT